jgi:hypothetical protein
LERKSLQLLPSLALSESDHLFALQPIFEEDKPAKRQDEPSVLLLLLLRSVASHESRTLSAGGELDESSVTHSISDHRV